MTDLIQAALRRVGLDVHRWKRSPKYTLLGLRALPMRSIVDVGANDGGFAKWAARLFPAARIYAFEPLPVPYQRLTAWAQSPAQEGRVTTFNLALGDVATTAQMQLHADYSYSSSMLPATPLNDRLYPQTRRRSTISVPQETLDGMVERERLDLEPELLVKLDVQGFEDRVIAGGRSVLGKARGCIVEVDLDELYEGQARFPDLVRALDELGLTYGGNLDQRGARDGHVVYVDAVFVRH